MPKTVSEAEYERKFVTLEQATNVSQELLGNVLTVIDASIPSTTQAKAIKDIIKKMTYESQNDLCILSDSQSLPSKSGTVLGCWDGVQLTVKQNLA